MIKFSAEIRAAMGAEAHFDKVEARYVMCRSLKTPNIRRADGSMMAEITLRVVVLLQIGCRRALELTESFVLDANAGRFASSIESANALLETASALKNLQLRVEKAVKEKGSKAIDEFDLRAVNALVGSKASDWGDSEPCKVLGTGTILDRTRLEHMRTAVSGVGLALLLVITAIERYHAIESEFVRFFDAGFRTGGSEGSGRIDK